MTEDGVVKYRHYSLPAQQLTLDLALH